MNKRNILLVHYLPCFLKNYEIYLETRLKKKVEIAGHLDTIKPGTSKIGEIGRHNH